VKTIRTTGNCLQRFDSRRGGQLLLHHHQPRTFIRPMQFMKDATRYPCSMNESSSASARVVIGEIDRNESNP